MNVKSKIVSLMLSFLFIHSGLWAEISFNNPRLGIVISKTSFQQRWGVTQMSAHGWAAVRYSTKFKPTSVICLLSFVTNDSIDRNQF